MGKRLMTEMGKSSPLLCLFPRWFPSCQAYAEKADKENKANWRYFLVNSLFKKMQSYFPTSQCFKKSNDTQKKYIIYDHM